MSEGADVDFDVIVVGAGVAGTVCAHRLARQGHEVLLIDRGAEPGSKNLSGGVFYCRVMEQEFPGFAEAAPIERRVTRNCVSFLNESSFVNVDYWDERLAQPANAVTVLRARLDAWLAEQCEAEGVTVMPGFRVDGLIAEDGAVVGIRAGDEELRCRVVVAADGVNSFLARSLGMRAPEPHANLAVGVKSVVSLPASVIEERFHLREGEGAAYAMVGDCTQGVAGGGFLYTNEASRWSCASMTSSPPGCPPPTSTTGSSRTRPSSPSSATGSCSSTAATSRSRTGRPWPAKSCRAPACS
jgi:electron transfer flavoprotein-quinone oxidoreductase